MPSRLCCASKIYGSLASWQRLPSTIPPVVPRPTLGIQYRHNSGIAKDWKGSSGEKHATHRTKKEHDTTDPQTKGSSRSMKERKESYGVGNTAQSDAATERGGRKNERKAKEEHPKAPEPILGMNDERAGKGV